MKKFTLAVLLAILFSSCATLEHIDGYQSLIGIDLRPYTEKDFLITPNDYAGKYKSIAILDYVIMPEANYKTIYPYSGDEPPKEWVHDKVDITAAMDSIYEICLDMGANAIINFEISPHADTYTAVENPTTVVGKRISGMAIQRLND
jgi:hypothetical protein